MCECVHEGGRGATYDSKSPPSSSQAARMLGTKESSYMYNSPSTRVWSTRAWEKLLKHWTMDQKSRGLLPTYSNSLPLLFLLGY